MPARCRISRSCLLLSVTLSLVAGCRGADLVLPDFRLRDNNLTALREEIWSGEFGARSNDRARGEDPLRVAAYRERPAPAPVQRLVLTPATSGHDADGQEGDEALRLVLEPLDDSDRPVPVAASLLVEAHQLGVTGARLALCSWEIAPEDLARAWRADWAGSGYTLTLPWKSFPTTEQLRVSARLTLADGSRHEAIREIRVRLCPSTWKPVLPLETDHPAGAGQEGRPGEHTARSGVEPAVRWEPTPLENAVNLGRPVPLPTP
ncbi:MAG: hypothetical protein L0Z62_37820 [Gemmataceae bacterium]|nr:hypothetical protein [Gemmataceae bacterium]